MRIANLYKSGRPVVSLEVFPPKKEADFMGIRESILGMSGLSPDFMSVTYGAGGAGSDKTAEIAALIENTCGVTALAHITCVGASREKIRMVLDKLQADGIENVLALRGDLPDGAPGNAAFSYAKDLTAEIRKRGGFCVGAACYPEGHIDCENLADDMRYLLQKQESGADFLITQLFFDNGLFYRFLERARAGGVTLPVSAGVMPILSRAQIERMIFMCGASLPSDIVKLLHKYERSPEDLRKAGIERAAAQIRGLVEQGVDGVHIYTMNKPEAARVCMAGIGRV